MLLAMNQFYDQLCICLYFDTHEVIGKVVEILEETELWKQCVPWKAKIIHTCCITTVIS